jgi:AcrR family transcriptional regulator
MNQYSSSAISAPERLRARMRVAVRDAILEAAELCVAEGGVEAASLQAIAKRAGVAVGTIYNHFEDRQDLFRSLFDARRTEIIAAVTASMKEHASASLSEQLLAVAETALAHYDQRRAFFRVAIATESLRIQMFSDKAGKFRPGVVQLEGIVARVMRAGVRQKVLAPDGADLYAPLFVSMLRGVLVSRLDDKRPLLNEANRVVHLFLRGAAR